MSTDLVVINNVAPPSLYIRPDAVNYDILERILAEEEARQGSFFPGNVYTFRKGFYYNGFGKEAPKWNTNESSLIMNLPNMWFGWQMWEDGKPTFGAIARPALGEKLPERKTLGKTEKELWDVDNYGKPQDPWRRYAAIPFRFDGQTEVNTLLFNSWSAQSKIRDLLKKYAAGARTNFGKLPVVNIDSAEERHWDDESITFFVPTFDLIAWEFPIDVDVGGEPPVTDAPIPTPNVKQTTRMADAPLPQMAEQAATDDMKSFVEEVKATEVKSARRTSVVSPITNGQAPPTPAMFGNDGTTSSGRRRSNLGQVRR